MQGGRIAVVGLVIISVATALIVKNCGSSGPKVEILNVSYDPTRELYRKLNQEFAAQYKAESGVVVRIRQSHGGSGSQARSVIDGIPADIVTLAMWSDTNALAKRGLMRKDWEQQFPNRSLPYYSTIVMVVRKGNEKGIHDWPDLLKPGVEIIGPNPKTSGGAKLNLLAAWGAVLKRHGITANSPPEMRNKAEAAAKEFVTQMYRQSPILDSGARGATVTFARRGIGHVHLTWENEARLEVAELPDDLEIVYPSSSIMAEPHVAIVDVNVDRKGTRAISEAYMRFLFENPKAREIFAANGFRPRNMTSEEEVRYGFPSQSRMELFRIDYIDKGGWDAAQSKFFSDGGIFDQIYQK